MTNFLARPLFNLDPANYLLLPRRLGGNFSFDCEVIFFTGPAPTIWPRGWFFSFFFLSFSFVLDLATPFLHLQDLARKHQIPGEALLHLQDFAGEHLIPAKAWILFR